MLVVLASAWDDAARELARRWRHLGAQLLTPFDLSRPGWCFKLGGVSTESAVIEGEVIDPSAIRGVLTRLPCVSARELPHIVAEDRDYVAAEMHAFLFAWLSNLRCPVLNRPTAFCLAGPSWRPEQWVHLAASLGMDVEPTRRTVEPGAPIRGAGLADQHGTSSVTVAKERHAGSSDPLLVEQAHQLAAGVGVDFLTVFFRRSTARPRFSGASLWPDIAEPAIADLLLTLLQDRDFGRTSDAP